MVQQTFAVVSVEERNVNDGGFLLFSLKHIAVLRPVFLLKDPVVYLWERLLHCLCVISGLTQRLCREQLVYNASARPGLHQYTKHQQAPCLTSKVWLDPESRAMRRSASLFSPRKGGKGMFIIKPPSISCRCSSPLMHDGTSAPSQQHNAQYSNCSFWLIVMAICLANGSIVNVINVQGLGLVTEVHLGIGRGSFQLFPIPSFQS